MVASRPARMRRRSSGSGIRRARMPPAGGAAHRPRSSADVVPAHLPARANRSGRRGPVGALAMGAGAKTSAAATSSRALNCRSPDFFTSRTAARVIALDHCDARDAANRSRDPSSTDNGPSAAPLRSARISSLASDQRVRRASTGHPFTTSCSSASRNLSQRMACGRPHAARAASWSAAGGWTRRPSATLRAPVWASARYSPAGTRSRRSCASRVGTPGATASASMRPVRQTATAADHARPPPRS